MTHDRYSFLDLLDDYITSGVLLGRSAQILLRKRSSRPSNRFQCVGVYHPDLTSGPRGLRPRWCDFVGDLTGPHHTGVYLLVGETRRNSGYRSMRNRVTSLPSTLGHGRR